MPEQKSLPQFKKPHSMQRAKVELAISLLLLPMIG